MPFNRENHREFKRYSVSLNAEVTSLDELANSYSETTVLKDISGGGASFATTRPDHYSVGQTVDITIQLPGGSSLSAKIKGAGKVAWMGELEEGETTVGLCMNDLLVFDNIADEND